MKLADKSGAAIWSPTICAAVMVGVVILVSTGGAASRLMDQATGLELAFWRSAFAAVALCGFLLAIYGPAGARSAIVAGGWWTVLSALCWATMLTAFMAALTITSVANVLIVLAIDPLLTALVAGVALGYRVPLRTWLAGCAVCLGIGWLFGGRFDSTMLTGTAVALLVPIAASANWTLSQYLQTKDRHVDLLPAVMLGAILSALISLPFALPFQASERDVAILAATGLFQCALPCAATVVCARTLRAPDLALLLLLEVVCGIGWAWLIGAEAPTSHALIGVAIVLAAVAAHQVMGIRQETARPGLTTPA